MSPNTPTKYTTHDDNDEERHVDYNFIHDTYYVIWRTDEHAATGQWITTQIDMIRGTDVTKMSADEWVDLAADTEESQKKRPSFIGYELAAVCKSNAVEWIL